jgi:hypothetical protein
LNFDDKNEINYILSKTFLNLLFKTLDWLSIILEKVFPEEIGVQVLVDESEESAINMDTHHPIGWSWDRRKTDKMNWSLFLSRNQNY